MSSVRERKGIDSAKIALLHEQIEAGEVPLGPFPDHSAPAVDIRDMRDPEAMGSLMQAERDHGFIGPASEIYDSVIVGAQAIIPLYNKSESTATIAAKKYIAELEEREANGDIFAASSLAWYRERGTFHGAPSEPAETK